MDQQRNGKLRYAVEKQPEMAFVCEVQTESLIVELLKPGSKKGVNHNIVIT